MHMSMHDLGFHLIVETRNNGGLFLRKSIDFSAFEASPYQVIL